MNQEEKRTKEKTKQEFHLENKIISGHFFSFFTIGIIAINDDQLKWGKKIKTERFGAVTDAK